MTAWSTIVAERMGFKRQEALSIGKLYTDFLFSEFVLTSLQRQRIRN